MEDKHNPEKQKSDNGYTYEQKADCVEKTIGRPETPKQIEVQKTDDVVFENNRKEEEENKIIESKVVEAPPPSLDKASEVIDEFISALSSRTKDDQSKLPNIPEVFEHFAFLVEANIANHDLVEYATKWSQQAEKESISFFKSVERVSNLTHSLCQFPSEPEYALSFNRINGILHHAMCNLEEEFRDILEDPKFVHNFDNQKDEPPQSPKKSIDDNVFPGYSQEAISKLNNLRYAMEKAGYGAECYQAYIVSRRTILEQTLHKLGFEKLSLDEIQKMQWESLEGKIVSWNKTFKEFFSVHFSSERKLSVSIFSDDKLLSDSLFNNIALIMMVQLLTFAEAIAITKISSQKLFKFIDIYEALHEAISTMDSLFPEETANEIKSEASRIRTKLGEAMVVIFCELEISIKADTGKNNVPGGAVHPLTCYTLNYLKYACEYKDTLEQVFKEHGNDENNQRTGIQSPFALEINRVMDLLDANLDSKSKSYKDTSLSAIFMMNNGRYILQKMKGSPEIDSLMGDTWTRKRSSDLRNFHKTYQRETWNRLLNCLSPEGLSVNGKVMKPVLKEKFKSFNAMFDEIHKTQSGWVVSDEQLQTELRVSISAIVIPAYRSFLARFSGTFSPGRQTEKYIKYQPEDIETCIEELFDGNSNLTSKRKS